MLDELWQITEGLNHRFPDGNDPYQIMTRLLEECGELAQQVNHFEGGGVKHQKYGEPDKHKMAKEIMDVLRAALQIALYYEARPELDENILLALVALKREGYIS
jgi:NTP pyrophosphatase (non-canonical NTP hydrolase)